MALKAVSAGGLPAPVLDSKYVRPTLHITRSRTATRVFRIGLQLEPVLRAPPLLPGQVRLPSDNNNIVAPLLVSLLDIPASARAGDV